MRKQLLRFMSLVGVALAVCFFTAQRAAADDDDPPSRVARLAFTSGNISFNPAGTDDWVAAVVNRPMTTGDKLWSDDGARAELHLGSATIRLSDHTGFSFLNLTDEVTQLRLTEGTLNIRVRRLGDDETFEVDTPNLALSVLRPGSYRINVNEAGDATIVAVRDGQGEITGGGSAYTIHAHEEGAFSGSDQLDADIHGAQSDGDDFDQWCYDRDRRAEHSASARYVSDDVVGYEDLDANGGWRPVPEYGNVWFPNTVVVGWAPYRYGHWVWIAPWGWTWVDDAPWGFAPFHYGRWVVVGGVWGWVPSPPRPVVVGAVYVRPVYAPALVAWVGGPHFGVGVAVGAAPAAGVAWFPLGPRDVFCPSYHVSQTYVTNVNVSNTTIVNRVQVTNVYNNVYVNKTSVTNITYQNQTQVNAVTATSRETFVSAGAVHNNMIRVDAKEVASAPVAPMTPAVAPQQRSVVGAGAQARFTPPAAVANRAVVAKAAPPPAPVTFAKQQQMVQANGGRPPAMSQIRQAQPEASASGRVNAGANANANVKMAPPVRQGPAQNAPANRATEDAQQSNSNRPGAANNSSRPGQGNTNPPNPSVREDAPNQGNSNRPGNTPANPGSSNQSGNAPGNQSNSRGYNDRPPTSRPSNAGNAPANQSNSNGPGTANNASRPAQGNVNPPVREDAPSQGNSSRSGTANNAKPPSPPARQNPPSQASKPVNTSANQGNSRANNNRPPSASQKPAKQDRPAKQEKAAKSEKSEKSDKPHH